MASLFSSTSVRTLQAAHLMRRSLPNRLVSMRKQASKARFASEIRGPSTKSSKILQAVSANKRRMWKEAMEHEEAVKGVHPTSDVFFTQNFAPQVFCLAEAVEIYQRFAAHEMLDHEDGEMFLQFQLNMRTKKSNKFAQNIDFMLLLPHRIDFVQPRKVLVFTADLKLKQEAMKLGAFDSGGQELVEKLETGFHHRESYDDVICHEDFFPSLEPLRKLLRERYPSVKSKRVGTDIETMLKLFMNGTFIFTKKEDAIPEISTFSVPLGRLNWPPSHLQENYSSYLTTVKKAKPGRVVNDFIEKVELLAPPSPYRLRLRCTEQSSESVVKEVALEEEGEKEEKRGVAEDETLLLDEDNEEMT